MILIFIHTKVISTFWSSPLGPFLHNFIDLMQVRFIKKATYMSQSMCIHTQFLMHMYALWSSVWLVAGVFGGMGEGLIGKQDPYHMHPAMFI